MSSLTLYDESRFNRDLGILFSGGLASGVIAALLVAIAGSHHHELMALSFGGLVGIASLFTQGDGETPILRVILALLGGLLLAGAFPSALFAALVGGGAIGLALSIDSDARDRVGSIVVFALALGAAYFTSSTLFESGFLQGADLPLVRELLTGGIWGTFMAAGAGVKQVRWSHDPQLVDLKETAGKVGASERRYLDAARELYRPIHREIEKTSDDDLRSHAEKITDQTLQALKALTLRSTELRDAMLSNPGHNLGRRVERLEGRLERIQGPSGREELRAAKREVEEEIASRDRVEIAITRLEVRQQRCVTALERLHMNLVECGHVETAEMGLEASLNELDDLTDQVQWRNLSLEEICDPISGEIEQAARRSEEEAEPTDLEASEGEEPTVFADSPEVSGESEADESDPVDVSVEHSQSFGAPQG